MASTFVTCFSAILAVVSSEEMAALNYTTGGATWGDHYPLCANGKEQSPLDLFIEGATVKQDMELKGYAYENMNVAKEIRNPNSIVTTLNSGEFQLNFFDGSSSLFQAMQFHFHSPAEHTYLGQVYDLEMHIVHHYKDQPNVLGAVIAIFFDRKHGGNIANPFLDSL